MCSSSQQVCMYLPEALRMSSFFFDIVKRHLFLFFLFSLSPPRAGRFYQRAPSPSGSFVVLALVQPLPHAPRRHVPACRGVTCSAHPQQRSQSSHQPLTYRWHDMAQCCCASPRGWLSHAAEGGHCIVRFTSRSDGPSMGANMCVPFVEI